MPDLSKKTNEEILAMVDKVQHGKVLDKDRLTAIIQTYHEQVGEQPVSMRTSYAQTLQGTGESWQRKGNLTTDWVSLESWQPWVDTCGLLLIINKVKKYATNPTDEQKAEDAKQHVGIRFGAKGQHQMIIRPGRFLVLEPLEWRAVHMRCLAVSAKVHVFMVPK